MPEIGPPLKRTRRENGILDEIDLIDLVTIDGRNLVRIVGISLFQQVNSGLPRSLTKTIRRCFAELSLHKIDVHVV